MTVRKLERFYCGEVEVVCGGIPAWRAGMYTISKAVYKASDLSGAFISADRSCYGEPKQAAEAVCMRSAGAFGGMSVKRKHRFIFVLI